MPVEEREGSRGQVLRGVCPICGQITKRRDSVGLWVSRCVHGGARYEGRMMPGGKKTIPVIPDSVDRGDLSGVVGALERKPEIDPRHGRLEPVERDPLPIRGLVARDEPRDDEQPVSGRDPVGYPVRDSLRIIGEHAQGLAMALHGAQGRIRELEQLVANAAIETASLRELTTDQQAEIDRMQAELEDEWRNRGIHVPDADAADLEGENIERDGTDTGDLFELPGQS